MGFSLKFYDLDISRFAYDAMQKAAWRAAPAGLKVVLKNLLDSNEIRFNRRAHHRWLRLHS